jgi:hypothetical protein
MPDTGEAGGGDILSGQLEKEVARSFLWPLCFDFLSDGQR